MILHVLSESLHGGALRNAYDVVCSSYHVKLTYNNNNKHKKKNKNNNNNDNNDNNNNNIVMVITMMIMIMIVITSARNSGDQIGETK